jgi:hypothetical protein
MANRNRRYDRLVYDSPRPDEHTGIDYHRLYAFRFRRIDPGSRQKVWDEIARFMHRWMDSPQRVLDPAAGGGQFINATPAAERWAIDLAGFDGVALDPDVKVHVGDARTAVLPDGYFDGVFVSNLLEHFTSQEQVSEFLRRIRASMIEGGRIVVLGPNFRYSMREYYDCADHTLALTATSVEEHLYTAGFEVVRVVPRFLPYSFRGRLPRAPWLVRCYLHFPLAWRVLGKQFLVLGVNPRT